MFNVMWLVNEYSNICGSRWRMNVQTLQRTKTICKNCFCDVAGLNIYTWLSPASLSSERRIRRTWFQAANEVLDTCSFMSFNSGWFGWVSIWTSRPCEIYFKYQTYRGGGRPWCEKILSWRWKWNEFLLSLVHRWFHPHYYCVTVGSCGVLQVSEGETTNNRFWHFGCFCLVLYSVRGYIWHYYELWLYMYGRIIYYI